MPKIVGDIAVQVGADISGLQSGMKRAGKDVNVFGKQASEMGANLVKTASIVTVAMAGIAASVLAVAKQAGEAGREIKNLSDISGVGTTEFQRYAAAAKIVGVEQEKLGDIFKDVNDKFGDFMETGGGPLADFFENIAPAVGVTADQFARLSGPEALQLYVSSLEKAGISQQRMTFYMEALASDATALLPLLRDGGKGFRELGDEAQRAGRIMSADAIDAAVVLDRELQDMTDTLRTQAIEAVVEYKKEILAAADFITDTLIPAMGSIAGAASDFVTGLQPAIDALTTFWTQAKQFGDGFKVKMYDANGNELSQNDATFGQPIPPNAGDIPVVDETTDIFTPPRLNTTVEGDGSGLSLGGGGSGKSKKGGGGRSRGPTQEDFERFAEAYASEAEQLDAHLESQLEKLEEYREAKLASEEEYNELEREIRQKHHDDMDALDKAAQQAKIQALQGMFGDLSSLMQSENDKLFKIGQAAAIADATVTGLHAAIEAWDKGMVAGGPAGALAFSVASLAKTGSMISQIAAQSPSGSGGGGGAGAAIGGAGAPEVGAQTPLQVSLNTFGEGRFIDTEDWGQVLDHLNDAAGDRGYTITRRA